MSFEKIEYSPFDVLSADQINKIQDELVRVGGFGYYTFKEGNEPPKRSSGALYGLILADYREVE